MANNFISGPTNRLIYDLPVGEGDLSGQPVKVGYLLGTIQQDADSDDMAPVDMSADVVYAHTVNNTITYDQGVAATFEHLAIGDVVYYDATCIVVDPAHTGMTVRLTKSPLDSAGNFNCVFGKIVGLPADYAELDTVQTIERVWVLQDKAVSGCDENLYRLS
jgi:hypothetical protein